MTTLYQHFRPDTRRTTKVVRDADTGLPVIIKTQDRQAILDGNKRLASHFDPIKPRTGSDEWTLVARVPVADWEEAERLGITKDRRAFEAWLDMRDCAAFRTDDRRRLA